MKKNEILAKVATGALTVDKAANLLADLESSRRGVLYCKVSLKGAVSIYGLQCIPVTLYADQWERLLEFADDIRAFLEQHNAEVTRKSPHEVVAPKIDRRPPATIAQKPTTQVRPSFQTRTPTAKKSSVPIWIGISVVIGLIVFAANYSSKPTNPSTGPAYNAPYSSRKGLPARTYRSVRQPSGSVFPAYGGPAGDMRRKNQAK